MLKKCIGAICATLLMFAVPLTAFGESSQLAATDFPMDGDQCNMSQGDLTVTITDLSGTSKIKGASLAEVEPDAALFPPSYDMLMAHAWKVTLNVPSGDLHPRRDAKVNIAYRVTEKEITGLPASVDASALKGWLSIKHLDSGGYERFPTASVPGVISGYTFLENAAIITVGIVTDKKDSNMPAQSGINGGEADAPETIDGMPVLNVSGSTGVRAWGNLGGANLPEGARVGLSASIVSSGAALDQLRAAMGDGGFLGAYEIDLSVNGNVIHDRFGELHLSFPVGYEYGGRQVTVWHRHNDGTITRETTKVEFGVASITVTDLSLFAIELDGAASPSGTTGTDHGATSPKTGQVIPSGAVAVVSCALLALGGTAMLFVRNRRTR